MPDEARHDILDRVSLAARTFGDRGLAAEILTLFEAQCAGLLPAIVGPDRIAARDAAHTLRGSALGIGADRVAALSGAVEEVLSGEAGDVRVLLCDLRAAVDATLAEIARWRRDRA